MDDLWCGWIQDFAKCGGGGQLLRPKVADIAKQIFTS